MISTDTLGFDVLVSEKELIICTIVRHEDLCDMAMALLTLSYWIIRIYCRHEF